MAHGTVVLDTEFLVASGQLAGHVLTLESCTLIVQRVAEPVQYVAVTTLEAAHTFYVCVTLKLPLCNLAVTLH